MITSGMVAKRASNMQISLPFLEIFSLFPSPLLCLRCYLIAWQLNIHRFFFFLCLWNVHRKYETFRRYIDASKLFCDQLWKTLAQTATNR